MLTAEVAVALLRYEHVRQLVQSQTMVPLEIVLGDVQLPALRILLLPVFCPSLSCRRVIAVLLSSPLLCAFPVALVPVPLVSTIRLRVG
jgi:hypothetical protein